MTGSLAIAVVLGTLLGVGAWLVVSTLPSFGRPRLVNRVAPYVLDVSPEARELVERRTANPLPVFGLILSPVADRLARALDSALGGSALLERRLAQAGLGMSAREFRGRQLMWGAGGAVLGALVDVVAYRSYALPLPAQLAIIALLAVVGVVLKDRMLQRSAQRRVAQIAEELPTVLEFLTLSLSAGESILDALRRISRTSRGELAVEIAGACARTATGIPLADTLTELADRLQLPAFTRTVEQIVGALERGTPLADVLRAQAEDVRVEAKRELLESAGRKEVAMLVPLVFLILPVTILFAIFPGILVLRMGF
jgi:tight adherence protein C